MCTEISEENEDSEFSFATRSALLLDQVLKFVGLVKGDHRIFNGDGAFFAELTQGAGYRFAGGT